MPVSEPVTILVTGPPLSGVTGVSRGLRNRLGGECRVVERLGPGERAAAVVFVVSAAAPMTDSDAEFLAAAADPAAAVAVVSRSTSTAPGRRCSKPIGRAVRRW